jgi:hypothetical protein
MRGVYHIVRRAFLLPVETESSPVLPGIVSQPSPPRDGLEIYGCQNFASALGTDHNCSTKNSSDITISAGSSVTKLYAK